MDTEAINTFVRTSDGLIEQRQANMKQFASGFGSTPPTVDDHTVCSDDKPMPEAANATRLMAKDQLKATNSKADELQSLGEGLHAQSAPEAKAGPTVFQRGC